MTWREVDRNSPCAICGKPDWCGRSEDGALRCMRIAEPPAGWRKLKVCPDGGMVFRSDDETAGNASAARTRSMAARRNAGGKPAKTYPTLNSAIAAVARSTKGRHVETWAYHHSDGREAFRVVRLDMDELDPVTSKPKKQFRPIHECGEGWRIGDPPGPPDLLPLYRLPHLSGQPHVFIVEGEKCADALAAIGLPSTTSAHGSKSAAKANWQPLAGRECIILPDADDAGTHYAETVASILHRLDCAVRVVGLPGLPAGSGADVVDLIAERRFDGKDDAAIRTEIEALAELAQLWQPGDDGTGPVLTCLADVEPREVQWLWPGRVPAGRITLLVGRPGEGKSFVSLDMAARISNGRDWPDGGACPSGSVVLVSAEDDPADTIRPRLDAHLADVRKVHLLSMVRRRGEGGQLVEAMFTLEDVPALQAALERHHDCKLIVIDPIGSFLGGGTDAHRDNEVRSVLAPVAKLAERYGPAVLIVAHRRKSAGSVADDLALGSRAFTGIARAVWHLTRDPNNKNRRLLLAGKNNLAPEGTGLAFDIGGIPPAIQWESNPVNMCADDALASESDGEGDGGALEEAMEFLRAELAEGRRTGAEVKEAAKAAGIKTRTLDRARARLGVVTAPDGYRGPWTWALPHHASPDSARASQGAGMANSGECGEVWSEGVAEEVTS